MGGKGGGGGGGGGGGTFPWARERRLVVGVAVEGKGIREGNTSETSRRSGLCSGGRRG